MHRRGVAMQASTAKRLSTLTSALLIGAFGVAPAFGAAAFVPGKSSPYLAGMGNGSTCCQVDRAPDESPGQVGGLALSPGLVLTFSVNGSVSNDSGKPPTDPPDGSDFFTTPFNGGNPGTPPANGIAGINAPVNALVGVFLDNGDPSSTPT